LSLTRHRQDWEALAAEDPLWAVLTDPTRRRGRWDPEAFFATGEREVAEVLARAQALGAPASFERALDFGCGVGRLTRALATRFTACVGVDIAAGMVDLARRLNEDRPNCEFVVNDAPDLRIFEDGSFDLALSSLVLQHLPDRRVVVSFVGELVRVVKPDGLVVFQLPHSLPALARLQLSRRLYGGLKLAGLSDRTILTRTPLTPMRMTAVAEERVREVVASAGGAVLAADPLDEQGRSRRYWVSPSSSL
jgi:SAM-dependent methyltransferase